MDLCMKKIITLIICLLVSFHSTAEKKQINKQMNITDAYIRALPAGISNTAAFMQIKNNSSTAITLNKLSSSFADKIEVHESILDNGHIKMREITHLTWQANETIHFTPGAYHIMFIGLNQTLTEGQKVDLNICFGDFCQHSELTVINPVNTNNIDHSSHHKH